MPFAASQPDSGPWRVTATLPAAAALLVQGARAGRTAEAAALVQRAAGLEPDRALPLLWLATLEADDEAADARIAQALDLDLEPPPWRTASGELLVALALKRRARHPLRALEILAEASHALPRDPRVWLAMAVTTESGATRVTCLERAHELRGLGDGRIRPELLSAAVASARDMARNGRPSAASAMLVRAAALAPDDVRLWALAARLASPFEARDILDRAVALNRDNPAVCAVLTALPSPTGDWAVGTGPGAAEVGDGPSTSLDALDATLRPAESLLAEYVTPRIADEFVRSAARWTGRLSPDHAPLDRTGDGWPEDDRQDSRAR